MDRVLVALCDEESVTLTTKEWFPTVAEGVPLIAPVEASSERPPGSAVPASSDQVYGRLPPVAETVALYARLFVASGRLAVVIDGGGFTIVIENCLESLRAGFPESLT